MVKMNAANALELFLLGRPQILVNGKEAIGFNTRKDRALLAYLAVTGTAHSREHLAGLLWSDLPESKALRNLRHTLSYVRKVIGPAWIEASHSLSLNPNLPLQVDVQTLRTSVDDFTRLPNDKINQHAVDTLDNVLKLYRGEFLQGFYLQKADLFDEWVLMQRADLHLLALQGLELVGQHALVHGQYATGLAAARRLIQLEAWSEMGHRLMMDLLASSGQRATALLHYEQYQKLLADELGIEPLPETTALYAQIQAGTVNETRLPRAPISVVSPSPATSPATSPVIETALSRSVVPHNLLTSLTTFVGRADELAFIGKQLTTTDCRLLTIIGPGGIGKSSLALAAGHYLLDSDDSCFPGGIFFISLAGIEIEDAESTTSANRGRPILKAIAESLGCQLQDSQPLQVQLQTYLYTRRLLLIVDNFEQLAAYTDIIIALLANAPTVTMLITSRVRLNIRGETTLVLKGLSLLNTEERVSWHENARWQKSEAVTLFVKRAQSLAPNFRLNAETIGPISQICQAVAGLPLAIEMAAAWVPLCSCAEIAEKLTQQEQADELLTAQFLDQPKRHQDLKTIFDDSWALLLPDGQWALARLSIFGRHFTRKAAQAVTDVTLAALMHLRNHSLLQVDAENYSLHPLIKEFAAQKWLTLTQQQPQQRHQFSQAHSRYYLQEVAALISLRGAATLDAIQACQKDHIEIVRGWRWALQQEDRTLIQQSMAGLFRYLELTNQTSDGITLFDITPFTLPSFTMPPLSTTTTNRSDPIAIWLLVAQCHFLRRLAEHDQARHQLEALMPLLELVRNDEEATDQPTPDAPGITPVSTHTFALSVLGWIYYEQGDYSAAHHCFSTAYKQAESSANLAQMMQAQNGLGAVAFSTKAYPTAQQYYVAALTHAQQQTDLHYTAIVLGNLAALAQATNAYGEAERYLQLRLQIDQRTYNVRQMAVSYQRLGQLALLRDAYATAEIHFYKSLTHFEQLGHSPEIVHVLLDLSKSHLRQNQLQQAEAQCLRGLQLAIHAQMTPRILSALTHLAEIRLAKGQKVEAATLLQMVNRNPQIPAVTLKTAQQLQKILTDELGEEIFKHIGQAYAAQSLGEFGLQLLAAAEIDGA